MDELLKIDHLHVEIQSDDKNARDLERRLIIKDLSLTVNSGEVHALMGPNGAGKSSLANTILGHPIYKVISGRIFFCGEDITELPTHERARKGLFMSFQNPVAVPGVSVTNFLRSSMNAVCGDTPVRQFRNLYKESMEKLRIDPSFTSRNINEGFSGGERKRFEVLQMAMLRPKLAILDEIDSGLDIDAMKIVSEGIMAQLERGMAILMITHYERLLSMVKPQYVHIFIDGHIKASGGMELAERLEKHGYEQALD